MLTEALNVKVQEASDTAYKIIKYEMLKEIKYVSQNKGRKKNLLNGNNRLLDSVMTAWFVNSPTPYNSRKSQTNM